MRGKKRNVKIDRTRDSEENKTTGAKEGREKERRKEERKVED